MHPSVLLTVLRTRRVVLLAPRLDLGRVVRFGVAAQALRGAGRHAWTMGSTAGRVRRTEAERRRGGAACSRRCMRRGTLDAE